MDTIIGGIKQRFSVLQEINNLFPPSIEFLIFLNSRNLFGRGYEAAINAKNIEFFINQCRE